MQNAIRLAKNLAQCRKCFQGALRGQRRAPKIRGFDAGPARFVLVAVWHAAGAPLITSVDISGFESPSAHFATNPVSTAGCSWFIAKRSFTSDSEALGSHKAFVAHVHQRSTKTSTRHASRSTSIRLRCNDCRTWFVLLYVLTSNHRRRTIVGAPSFAWPSRLSVRQPRPLARLFACVSLLLARRVREARRTSARWLR